VNETNERLEALGEGVTRGIVESEIRTATALTALAGDVRELTAFLRETQNLRPRVAQREKDIDAPQAPPGVMDSSGAAESAAPSLECRPAL
jgi:hypothetical protein